MTNLPKVLIVGCSGRMGQMLTEVVNESEELELAAALEREGHDWIGRDLSEARGEGKSGIIVSGDGEAAFHGIDVVLDFTTPAATINFSKLAAKSGAVHVIGTTGMTEDEIAALEPAAKSTVLVRAGNMSLGVNLLLGLTRKIASALGPDFDIEITESHHHHKVDAPSGTALMLGEAAAEGRGVSLKDVRDAGRDGITGARKTGDIGFHAIRGGDIVGEHEVLFAGAGERIKIGHIATDRRLFARGAISAALWGLKQAPGHYTMQDVLGL